MRILLAGTGVQPIPPTGYGGVERTIAEFGAALTAAGQTVTILNEVRRGRSIDELRFARSLRRRIRAGEYDVLHASTPLVAHALAQRRWPFVYTSHSRHWFEARGLGGRWGRHVERRAVRESAATVALTDRLRREILRQCGPPVADRVAVIPIGVATDRFVPRWEGRTGRRAIGVGVVRPFKRWEIAARALAGTGWELTIVGPTPDPRYAAEVRAAGEGVRLAGELPEDDLRRALSEADLMVHPSRVELLAGAVLQGMSSGLPVLGSAAVADLVPSGAGAAPAGESDAADLTRFLREHAVEYLRSPSRLREEGQRARQWAEARFAWPAVVGAHLELYRRALGAS